MSDKLNEREPGFAVRYAREVARLALVRRDPDALFWSVLALPRYEGGGRAFARSGKISCISAVP